MFGSSDSRRLIYFILVVFPLTAECTAYFCGAGSHVQNQWNLAAKTRNYNFPGNLKHELQSAHWRKSEFLITRHLYSGSFWNSKFIFFACHVFNINSWTDYGFTETFSNNKGFQNKNMFHAKLSVSPMIKYNNFIPSAMPPY